MTDVARLFGEMAADLDRQRARTPNGQEEAVDAPNLKLYEVLRGVGSNTDKALSDMFLRRYKHLFCNGDGQVHMYVKTSRRWLREDVENHIYSHAIHLSGQFYSDLGVIEAQLLAAEAAGNAEEVERLRQQRTSLHKIILHCEKSRTIGAVAKMVSAKVRTILDGERVRMNGDPELLACSNGAVDLRTGALRWSVLADHITRNTGVAYVPEIDLTWWKNIVLEICGGDEVLASFLQVWFGYCATGYTREHCMAVLFGDGRNGKNLLIDAVASALGQYSTALSAAFLEQQGAVNSGGDNNQLYMMAQLDGTRMAYVSETGERGKLRESAVKSLTGDKRVRARLAYENFYEFELTHKFIIGTNHKPEITGTDDGVWERIRLIPMRVKFGTQEEIDGGTAQRLKDVSLLGVIGTDRVREQVLAWIVEGARLYLEKGLSTHTPVNVASETTAYRREQDTLGQFLQGVSQWVSFEECVRVQERADALLQSPERNRHAKMTDEQLLLVDKMDLWRTYALWAEDNGHKAMSSTMFARRVTGAQRFWVQDDGSEKVMRKLESLRMARGYRYRYFRWSDAGLMLLDHARRAAKVRTDSADIDGRE